MQGDLDEIIQALRAKDRESRKKNFFFTNTFIKVNVFCTIM